MERGNAVREQLAKACVGPAVDKELGDGVHISAWIDPMSDAGAEHGEDGRGALSAEIPKGEEPIFATGHEGAELPLHAIIRQINAAVVEK
jgi:hypothetical protein